MKPFIFNFMTSCSFVIIKSLESIISIYSSTNCIMLEKLKEVLQSWKTILIVFGEAFVTFTNSKSHKSHDIDMEFYPSDN